MPIFWQDEVPSVCYSIRHPMDKAGTDQTALLINPLNHLLTSYDTSIQIPLNLRLTYWFQPTAFFFFCLDDSSFTENFLQQVFSPCILRPACAFLNFQH